MRIVVILLVTLCGITLSNATICVPYSRFKIDCNRCFCSEDGTKYSCTKKFCPEQKQFIYDDQDFVLPGRRGKVELANDDEGYQNDVRKDVDWDDAKANDIEDDDGNVYDESGENNSIDIDGEIPPDYRYKRPY